MESGRKLKWFIRCKMIDRSRWEDVPYWVPCGICNLRYDVHVDGKCPFQASNFGPTVPEIEMALNEMITKLPPKYDELRPMRDEWLSAIYSRCRDNNWRPPYKDISGVGA